MFHQHGLKYDELKRESKKEEGEKKIVSNQRRKRLLVQENEAQKRSYYVVCKKREKELESKGHESAQNVHPQFSLGTRGFNKTQDQKQQRCPRLRPRPPHSQFSSVLSHLVLISTPKPIPICLALSACLPLSLHIHNLDLQAELLQWCPHDFG